MAIDLFAQEEAEQAEKLAIIGIALSALSILLALRDDSQSVNSIQGIQGIQGIRGVAGVNGTNGTNGTNGAAGSSGPGLSLATIFAANVVSNANDWYLNSPFDQAGSAVASLVSTRVLAPVGSTWQVRISYDSTVLAGEVLSATIRSSATINGIYADTAAVASVNNGSGAAPTAISGTLTIAVQSWLTAVTRYTSVIAQTSQSQISLERLT